jgi:hypothetical protein
MLCCVLLLLLAGCCAFEDHHGHETAQQYSNEWVVRLEGGPEVAEILALQLGYEFLGSVSYALSHIRKAIHLISINFVKKFWELTKLRSQLTF